MDLSKAFDCLPHDLLLVKTWVCCSGTHGPVQGLWLSSSRPATGEDMSMLQRYSWTCPRPLTVFLTTCYWWRHEYVAAVLMDLSNAFDCLPHDLLLVKTWVCCSGTHGPVQGLWLSSSRPATGEDMSMLQRYSWTCPMPLTVFLTTCYWWRHEYVAAVLMDLSNAFDCLPHDLLLVKLQAYGLSVKACGLISSQWQAPVG